MHAHWFSGAKFKNCIFLHLPGDSAEIVLGHWSSAKVPPGGKMAELESSGLQHFSALVPPGGNFTEE